MRASLKATQHKEGRPLILAEHLDLPVADQPAPATSSADNPAQPVAIPSGLNLRDAVDNYQKMLISQALEAQQGNWSATARQLQTDRANLIRLAQRLGLKYS